MKNNFIGMDGFIWFLGVVEDRQDPYLIGRVRVRCFGHHTGDKVILPTEDLPWAQVMLPVTSAGISGIGQSPIGLVEGSHVFGFFRDGEARQEPVVMGSLPGYPTELGDTTKGFYSPISAGFDPHAPSYLVLDDDIDISNHPRWKDSPDTSQLTTKGDYSFNPSLTEHASIAVDKEIRESVGIVGVAITDPFVTASAFINKGGSSLFGFVTDMITSTLTPLIGNQLLSSLGGTLGGLSIMNNSFVDSITKFGRNAWQTITGLADEPFNALLETSLVKQTLAPDGFLSAEIFVKTANLTADVLDNMVKNGFQQVTNVDPSNPLAQGYEVFNVTNYALASQLLGADRITKNVDAFNLANEVVAKGEAITKDTLSSAQKFVNDAETTLTNQAQALQDAENKLRQSSSEVLVVRDAKGNIIELVDEERQDSISQQSHARGGKGIPVASTVTPAGRTKLMNQFIAKQGGVSLGWSMPTPPEVSEVYPYRHVYESESGHIMMYDDTPGNETIRQRHRTGTQYWIADDGTKNDIVVSDHVYTVTGTNKNVIKERQMINIGMGLKVKVNDNLGSGKDNHYEIVVGKGANVNIQVEQGDVNINTTDGNINMTSGGKIDMYARDDINIYSEQDVTINGQDDIILVAGDKIKLN